MRFSAALCVLTVATGAIASPLQAERDTDPALVDEESESVLNGEPGQAVQILEPETDPESTLTEEIVVTINDPDLATSKLEARLNTKGANDVAYGKAIAAAVEAAYTQAKQIKNWDKVRSIFLRCIHDSS